MHGVQKLEEMDRDVLRRDMSSRLPGGTKLCIKLILCLINNWPIPSFISKLQTVVTFKKRIPSREHVTGKLYYIILKQTG